MDGFTCKHKNITATQVYENGKVAKSVTKCDDCGKTLKATLIRRHT